MDKKRKIWNVISWILLLILLASEAAAGFMVVKMNILPMKYGAPLAAILGLLDIIIALCMFSRVGKWQKHQGHGKKITAYILAILITAACCLGTYITYKLSSTMDKVTAAATSGRLIGVYVMKEDPAQTIQDVVDYTFATTDYYGAEHIDETVLTLELTLNSKLQTQNYETIFSMVDALYAGEANAVILDEAYVGVLDGMEESEETKNYTEFSSRVRLLYEYEVTIHDEPEPTESQAVEQEMENETRPSPTTPKNITEKPFIVYLSGSDTRSQVLKTSRSDVNILAVVNPVTKQILLLNTPRDYYVPNPYGGGAKDKLTHCGLYGPECSMEALGDLYGQTVSYYAQINFTGFETLIDAVGGIDIYSDVSFVAEMGNIPIRKGENHLDGREALGFARERHSLAGGDNARGQNQMKVIAAVIEKFSADTIISNYSDILDSLEGMFRTSMSSDDISKLIKMQLSDGASWNVVSFAVTGTGGSEPSFSSPGHNAYVMYPDAEMVSYASGLIDRVIAGETLSEDDVNLEKE